MSNLFWESFFNFNPLQPVDSSIFGWISPHQHRKQAWSAGPFSGPRKIPGVTALCWGVCQGDQFEQWQTRQPKCPPPQTLGFEYCWIISNHSHSFYLFFSNQQLLNCFAQIPLSNSIPLSLSLTDMGFLGDASDPPVAVQPTAKKRRQVFPQIKTIWDSITEITRPRVSSFNNLPFAKAWYSPPLFTFFTITFFVSWAKPASWDAIPRDCWRTCDFNLFKAVMNPSLDPQAFIGSFQIGHFL